MSKEATFNVLEPMPKPCGVHYVNEEIKITPIELVRAYDDKEFESFIKEWALTLGDNEVFCIGGAGDKGRDVIVKYPDGTLDYYQCKQYKTSINPSTAAIEIGKLIFYTKENTIKVPKNYYFVASCDISPALSTLLEDSDKLRNYMLDNWNSTCKKSITSKYEILLDEELKEYINSFDFSIIKNKAIESIIEEHKNTGFYAFRFGGTFSIDRDKNALPRYEGKHNYAYKLFEMFSEETGSTISDEEELKKFPEQYEKFKLERQRFYRAINLKEFLNDKLMDSKMFSDLENDVYETIIDNMFDNFTAKERFNKSQSDVKNASFYHSKLVQKNIIDMKDKLGIMEVCADERDDIKWKK